MSALLLRAGTSHMVPHTRNNGLPATRYGGFRNAEASGPRNACWNQNFFGMIESQLFNPESYFPRNIRLKNVNS